MVPCADAAAGAMIARRTTTRAIGDTRGMRNSLGSRMVHQKVAVLAAVALVSTAVAATVVAQAFTPAAATRRATLAPVKPKVAETARPLALDAVRLTGGPLKRAQELDAQY